MTNDEQFLIDSITTELVILVMEDFHYGLEDSMDKVYTSDTYAKLVDVRTNLYTQSPLYIYDMLKEEYGCRMD
jgi:hypothetical protein